MEKTILSAIVLSDNEKYRYKLTRTWDSNKKNATVVMLNPSTADMLLNDRTVMNVTNFLIRSDYGSVTIVNLFAYRTIDPKLLKQREKLYESKNDSYLREAFCETSVIIVAWIRGKRKYVIRKREVENLLITYKDKVKCFEDNNQKKMRHPRDLGLGWKLTDYEFTFVDI